VLHIVLLLVSTLQSVVINISGREMLETLFLTYQKPGAKGVPVLLRSHQPQVFSWNFCWNTILPSWTWIWKTNVEHVWGRANCNLI